jgi:Domain of unknown function (DUF4118)
MVRIRTHRAALINATALLLPLGIAGIMVPFRASLANTASALVFVAEIVAAAAIGNRSTGILSTISSTVWFDFFLTRPYEQFAITRRSDIETAASLFVIGLIVTELASRSRRHRDVATERSDYIGLILGVSELVASDAPPQQVIEHVREELIGLLHLRGCRFESGPPERARMRIEHDGHVVIGEKIWGVDRVGLPGPELDLIVQSRGQTVGRFVLERTPGFPVSLQRRAVAVAVADQVGAALKPQLRLAQRSRPAG